MGIPEIPQADQIEYNPTVPNSGRIVRLIGNRALCGGIKEGIEAIKIYNLADIRPLYINHELSHNPRQTQDLLNNYGLIIEPDVTKVPPGNIYMASPHGAPKGLREAAEGQGLDFVDLTCVFVRTVQLGVQKDEDNERLTLYSGQRGHQEQIAVSSYREDPENFITIFSEQEAKDFIEGILAKRDGREITFRQQTTHSAITHDLVEAVLRDAIPDLKAPKRDTCRAVRHRQQSVLAEVKRETDVMDSIVSIGGPNSHNTKELATIAEQASSNAVRGHVVNGADDIKDEWFEGKRYISLTAGASTPPDIVEEVVEALKARGDGVVRLEQLFPEPHDEIFALPRNIEGTILARGREVPERLLELRSKTV